MLTRMMDSLILVSEKTIKHGAELNLGEWVDIKSKLTVSGGLLDIAGDWFSG